MILWLAFWARTKDAPQDTFFFPMIYPYWLVGGNGVDPPFVDVLNISIANSYPATGSGKTAQAKKAFQDKINTMCTIKPPFAFYPKQSPARVQKARRYLYKWLRFLLEEITIITPKYASYGMWALV